jgi:hypothetical protein
MAKLRSSTANGREIATTTSLSAKSYDELRTVTSLSHRPFIDRR